jgi:hypothetical protein
MIETNRTRWTALKREIVLETVFDTNRAFRTASHSLAIDATEAGGKSKKFKIGKEFDSELQSAVDEIEQGSDKEEFSLPDPLTLNCDAAGYTIGDGEAIFIFSALDDLKRFREKVSARLSEFLIL